MNIVTLHNPVQAAKRILLVSDDAHLRVLLSEALIVHGYDVTFGGAAAFPHRPAVDCDAAIVDAAAPHRVARWLRTFEATTRVPVIAIVAAKNGAAAGQLWNRVDAVLHEPFDARKLLLIMRGLFAGRRQVIARADQAMTVGPLTLDSLLNTATVAAREISLTGVETRLLRELMLDASAPVSRDRLTRCGLRRGWSPDDRRLDTHIMRLRRKLGPDRQGKTPIRTVRTIGYLLVRQWQPPS